MESIDSLTDVLFEYLDEASLAKLGEASQTFRERLLRRPDLLNSRIIVEEGLTELFDAAQAGGLLDLSDVNVHSSKYSSDFPNAELVPLWEIALVGEQVPMLDRLAPSVDRESLLNDWEDYLAEHGEMFKWAARFVQPSEDELLGYFYRIVGGGVWETFAWLTKEYPVTKEALLNSPQAPIIMECVFRTERADILRWAIEGLGLNREEFAGIIPNFIDKMFEGIDVDMIKYVIAKFGLSVLDISEALHKATDVEVIEWVNEMFGQPITHMV